MTPITEPLTRARSASGSDRIMSSLMVSTSPDRRSLDRDFSSMNEENHSILLKRKNTSRPQRRCVIDGSVFEANEARKTRLPFFARLKGTLAVLF